jgi:hypothetical protein
MTFATAAWNGVRGFGSFICFPDVTPGEDILHAMATHKTAKKASPKKASKPAPAKASKSAKATKPAKAAAKPSAKSAAPSKKTAKEKSTAKAKGAVPSSALSEPFLPPPAGIVKPRAPQRMASAVSKPQTPPPPSARKDVSAPAVTAKEPNASTSEPDSSLGGGPPKQQHRMNKPSNPFVARMGPGRLDRRK